MPTDRAIPEAVVKQVAAHWGTDWPPGFTTVVCDVLRSVPPLTGPGPNGEWGTWEQVGVALLEEGAEHWSLWPLSIKGMPPLGAPVYRFVPEATGD